MWEAGPQIDSPDKVYGLYSAAAEKNHLEASKIPAYVGALKSIADRRPPGAGSNIQGIPLGGAGANVTGELLQRLQDHTLRELPSVAAQLSGKKLSKEELDAIEADLQSKLTSQLANTFYRFERAGTDGNITERVYVNARAKHAPEVMKFIVGSMVDKPADFPGVELAKVAGPGAVGERSENIVVYTRDAAAAANVVKALAAYQAQHPDHFMKAVPPMTLPVLDGVARGAEPLPSVNTDGRYSFGSLRSEKIFAALSQARKENAGRERFLQLVDRQLRTGGVDPTSPDRNLAPR